MQHLTEKSAYLIRLMFLDPSVMKELIDNGDSTLWSNISIDCEECKIVLGKTRFSWWNSLIGATKEISLHEFALKIISLLTAKAEYSEKSIVSKGLLEDISDALVREGRTNDIIERLFLVGYLGVKTNWSCPVMSMSHNNEKDETTVNIQVNEEMKTFCLPGSGDPIFQVLFGPTEVRCLNLFTQECNFGRVVLDFIYYTIILQAQINIYLM